MYCIKGGVFKNSPLSVDVMEQNEYILHCFLEILCDEGDLL
jgi:hypothetical protein